MDKQQIKVAHLDDESTVIDFFKSKLVESQYIKYMGSARNGNEFVEKFKNTPLDIVLIDIGLEYDDLEGHEIAKIFIEKRARDNNPPKVILFTRWDNYAYAEIARKSKMSLIGKNVPREDLVEYIKLIHSGAQLIFENPNSTPKFIQRKHQGVKLAVEKLLSDEQIAIACLIRDGQTADDIARAFNCKSDHIRNQTKKIREQFAKIIKSENVNAAVIAAIMERSGLCSELDLHDLSKVITS